ncbi:unnamed protein product, partial [Medioppia subpectinata]
MPGFSVERFPELSGEERDDYTCSICQEIFNTPVTTTCCRQLFCEDCITQWLRTNTTCPYDRKQLTRSGLSQPPRLVVNTLNRFKIQCDHWAKGCREVIKLELLPQHTVNCRYNKPKCVKCQLYQTPVHDCIAALLHENNELKKKLAGQLVVNEAITNMSKLNINAREYCPSGQRGQTSGAESLTAVKRKAGVEINAIERALQRVYDGVRNDLGAANCSRFGQSLNDRANITDHQLLVECRRHVSAPELLNDNMNPDMRDNTLAIIRDQLVKQNTLYNVCKYVAKQMDLEYGVSWHCVTDRGDSGLPYYTYDRSNLMLVKIARITLLLFRTKT